VEDLVRQCLGFRVGAAFRSLDRYFTRLYQPLGLSHAHGQALACLLQEEEVRIGTIAERTGLDASTVSRLVKELCRRRLVRRRPDPEDARAHILCLAKRGKAMRDAVAAVIAKANARIRRDVPEADLIGLERACEIMQHIG